MKKPKISLGSGGIKGLIVQHVEKLVFGLAVLAVIAFVFLGYRLDSKLGNKTPDGLATLATNAEANINKPSADELRKMRVPRDGQGGQYYARVDQDDPPDPQAYAIKPWAPPMARPGSKREDPAVFAPLKLETTALIGPLCIRSEGGEKSLLADLKYSPAPEKKERVRKERRPRGGGGGGSGSGSGSMMPGAGGGRMPGGSAGGGSSGGSGSGSMMPGAGGGLLGGGSPYSGAGGDTSGGRRRGSDPPKGPERTYPESKVCGYRPFGAAISVSGGMGAGGSGGSMMPGAGSGSMMPGAGSGSMMPGAGSGSMMPGGGSMMPGAGGGRMPGGTRGGAADSDDDEEGGASAGEPLAQPAGMIAVRAVVPYRKQADEYKRVLGEAIGYDPMRDMPRIVWFQAERADVTDNPNKELQDSDFELIMHPTIAEKLATDGRWHGFMQEVADPAYVDSWVTMPAPPLMLRCMESAMLHSEVPKSRFMPTIEKPTDDGKKKDDTKGEKKDGSDLPGGLPGGGFAGSRGPAGYPGMGGGSMMPGSGGSMMPGAGSMMPGSGGSMMPGAGSMMPGSGGSMMPGAGSMMPGSGGSMMPGAGSMMPGAGGGYPGSYSAAVEVAQYKLIRFYDTDVQPGRIYRYRVRVFLEDPNNPNTDPTNGLVMVPPPRRSLSLKVIDRLNKQQADEATKKVYYVTSDWSEVSGPATLPSPARAIAGEVEAARYSQSADGGVIEQSEPRGSLVAVVWNPDLAIDVGYEDKAVRGAVLNFERKQFDVLDPVTLVIKLLEGFVLKSEYLMADLRGGDDLPGDSDKAVVAPGEYLVIDAAGQLTVIDELDDAKDFARYTFADEITAATRSGSGGPGGGYPGGSGTGLMPGSGGGSMLPGTGAGGSMLPGTGAPGGSGRGGRRGS